MSKKERIKKYTDALQKLTEVDSIMLVASPISLFNVCTHLQLALGNSQADSETQHSVRTFAKGLQKTLADISPVVSEMLDVGWGEKPNDDLKAAASYCHLDDTLNYLKDFHKYLVSSDANIGGVMERLAHIHTAVSVLANYEDSKESKEWRECVDALKIVMALSRERYHVVLAGIEDIIDLTN